MQLQSQEVHIFKMIQYVEMKSCLYIIAGATHECFLVQEKSDSSQANSWVGKSRGLRDGLNGLFPWAFSGIGERAALHCDIPALRNLQY